MLNYKLPWPSKLPDDLPENMWREEVLNLFLDAIEMKIPLILNKTPKVYLSLYYSLNKIKCI